MSTQQDDPTQTVTRTDEEWRKLLTPEQYHILREGGTEYSFRGAYWDNHEKGLYRCAGCDLALYDSEAKYDSGTGWPSFYQAISQDRVKLLEDRGHGRTRIEVQCARCGGHLGHLFDDGPQPTGQRYCMNSAAMRFCKE